MEPVEERVEHTDTKDDAVAGRRPLGSEHVARRIAVHDLRGLAAHVRDGDARAFRVFTGPDKGEAVSHRTERWTTHCERQLVLRVATPRLDPGFSLERHALVKDHLRAVRRPRRRSISPAGPRLPFGSLDARSSPSLRM